MLNDVSKLFTKVGQPGRRDDDVFDKISRRWTVILMAVFLLAITSKHYFGDPIECWTPAEFKGSHNDYVKHYCWITYTYHVPNNITLNRNTLREFRTSYYIWIPFIFTLSALLFYIPCWVWHSLGRRARYDLPRVLSLAAKSVDSSDKLDSIVIYYDKKSKYIKYHDKRIISRITKCVFSPIGGGTVTAIYLFTKSLYLINAVGHFFLLNFMLGFDYHTYGWHVLKALIVGHDWEESRHFPRTTYCDIGVRYKGDNLNNYTVQCVLPVNLFHEKIFAILWFWFAFVAILTMLGIIYWTLLMTRRGRLSYVRRHLRLQELAGGSRQHLRYPSPLSDSRFEKFFNSYLGGDGVLLLRLVGKNSSRTLAGELLNKLWLNFLQNNAAPSSSYSTESDSAVTESLLAANKNH
ncbi:hypothetical protein GJ496_002453 [Pomphorhynchus laevis]|nr:hypothetical protein GJ496_002453 [Pomphorhynchus laevis]